jgi:hypothetical protein
MTDDLAFPPDRATYVRAHAWMAVIAMAGAMAVLWIMDNPLVWTGAVAGLAAIGLRGWYLASEELAADWRISDGVLTGPGERRVALGQIAQVRVMSSYAQVITKGGDKHLIRYQANARATARAIEAARERAAG